MAYEYANDWRIHIGDGGTPTEDFDALGGEGGFEVKRSSAEIDFSTKDDGVYGATGYGKQKITISVNGNVKLPDTALERVSDQSKVAPPELNINIMKGTVVKYHGRMGVGNFSMNAAKDAPVTYSFDLSNVAAPIVDDLTATS